MPSFNPQCILNVSAAPGNDERVGKEAHLPSPPASGMVTVCLSIDAPEGTKAPARVVLFGKAQAPAPWVALHGVKSKSEVYQVPAMPTLKAELLGREEGVAVRVDVVY